MKALSYYTTWNRSNMKPQYVLHITLAAEIIGLCMYTVSQN